MKTFTIFCSVLLLVGMVSAVTLDNDKMSLRSSTRDGVYSYDGIDSMYSRASISLSLRTNNHDDSIKSWGKVSITDENRNRYDFKLDKKSQPNIIEYGDNKIVVSQDTFIYKTEKIGRKRVRTKTYGKITYTILPQDKIIKVKVKDETNKIYNLKIKDDLRFYKCSNNECYKIS